MNTGSRVDNVVLDRERFHASFAGDVPADEAAFMADAQVHGEWTPR